MKLAAANYGRAIARHDANPPPPPRDLVNAWRTRDYGLPHGKGWRDEPANSLERMTYALNIYTAFRSFEERGEMTERDFAEQHFELWKIVIDIEKLEGQHAG